MKNEPKPYAERQREALMHFAMSVALDPASSKEDVQAAQRTLAEPSVDDALGAIIEPWRLAALAAILLDNEHTPRIRGLFV